MIHPPSSCLSTLNHPAGQAHSAHSAHVQTTAFYCLQPPAQCPLTAKSPGPWAWRRPHRAARPSIIDAALPQCPIALHPSPSAHHGDQGH